MKKQIKCECSRSYKIKSWLAFVLLFVCGVMVGIDFERHENKNYKFQATEPQIYLSPQGVRFSDLAYGESATRKIVVNANAPVKIVSVRLGMDYQHITFDTDCTSVPYVDTEQKCEITFVLKPVRGEYKDPMKEIPFFINFVTQDGQTREWYLELSHGNFYEADLDEVDAE